MTKDYVTIEIPKSLHERKPGFHATPFDDGTRAKWMTLEIGFFRDGAAVVRAFDVPNGKSVADTLFEALPILMEEGQVDLKHFTLKSNL